MKDNKEKLSNEAAEAVAGGFKWPWKRNKTKAPEGPIWSPSQKDYVRNNFGNSPDDVEDIFSRMSPADFVELADSSGLFSSKKLNEFKIGLGLK